MSKFIFLFLIFYLLSACSAGERTYFCNPATNGSEINSPWGIASSRDRSKDFRWLDKLCPVGISEIRGFDRSNPHYSIRSLVESGFSVSGVFIMNSSFPSNLNTWANYVEETLVLSNSNVDYWEVWNEAPNHSSNKSPVDYANLVTTAYRTAKMYSPSSLVGLSVASNYINFLDQSLVAGAKDNFDFIAVHPYESLDLVKHGFEAQFLYITKNVRSMLKARNPSKIDVPIHFTEIGFSVDSEEDTQLQAELLVKAYTMGLAQGVDKIFWYEGQDDSWGNFGLLDWKGNERKSFYAYKNLVSFLGGQPKYIGPIGLGNRYHGFLFDKSGEYNLVVWSVIGAEFDFQFENDVVVIDPITGQKSSNNSLKVTNAPLLISGVPSSWAEISKINRDMPYPWGKDRTDNNDVSYTKKNGADGIYPLVFSSNGKYLDGEIIDCSERPSTGIAVDPNFSNYSSQSLEVRIVIKRNGDSPAGFNLKYESVHGLQNASSWLNIKNTDWREFVWYLTDTQFTGRWGYNLLLDSDSIANSDFSIKSLKVKMLDNPEDELSPELATVFR